ncbi:hypothetical protein HO133_007980 [Letharia lupina]|uniref:Uncharacterized protein n=1 Tax=Letharia lupina TaxID=560253 RepID=A0A8H6CRB9_9LECA|nr:uncharacterized protein HO133_007980 [Letharia lupina]KAF6228250.1 hypothetical protein HO133_007980 [Letharia lupina]
MAFLGAWDLQEKSKLLSFAKKTTGKEERARATAAEQANPNERNPPSCRYSIVQTSLKVYNPYDTRLTSARTGEFRVPLLFRRGTSGDITYDINNSVDNHENIDAMEEMSSHTTRRVSQQTKKQEADRNLGDGAADEDGHFQGKVPFLYPNLLLRRQVNDMLAKALGYLHAVDTEGDDTADLFERYSYE